VESWRMLRINPDILVHVKDIDVWPGNADVFSQCDEESEL
jgi:hypothetical protein